MRLLFPVLLCANMRQIQNTIETTLDFCWGISPLHNSRSIEMRDKNIWTYKVKQDYPN